MVKPVVIPITIPRVIPASDMADTISRADSGGIVKSTIDPIIFPATNDDDVFANEFCSIFIIIRPGTRNCVKDKLATVMLVRPTDILKINKNNKPVIIGPIIVCVMMFMNRFTSL